MEETMYEQLEDVNNNKKSNYSWLVIVILLIIGSGFFAFNKMNKSDVLPKSLGSKSMEQGESQLSTMPTPAETTSMTSSPEGTAVNDSSNEGVKTFTLEAGSYYYKPNVISVKKGDKVKVILNAVDMMHNFNIDELNVKMPIVKSGNTGTVEFVVDKVGKFEFYCSVSSHRAKGQVGTLTVTN